MGGQKQLSFDDVKKCVSLTINADITILSMEDDMMETETKWNEYVQKQNEEEKDAEISVNNTDPHNDQYEQRFNVIEARLDSIVSQIEGMSKEFKSMTINMKQQQRTAGDTTKQHQNQLNLLQNTMKQHQNQLD